VEPADVVVVNKTDGELLRPRSPNRDVPVLSCSAASGAGVEEVWNCVER